MDDSNKKEFWLMINITMELTNHPALSKEAIIAWWHQLSKFDYQDVQNAIDQWLKASNRPPTPHDIKQLCVHKVTISPRLAKSSLSRDESKYQSEKVTKYIKENLKPKTDYHAWFKRILANPQNFPSDSVSEAKRVASEFGYKR
jgi:hypothetical protein